MCQDLPDPQHPWGGQSSVSTRQFSQPRKKPAQFSSNRSISYNGRCSTFLVVMWTEDKGDLGRLLDRNRVFQHNLEQPRWDNLDQGNIILGEGSNTASVQID